MCVRRVLDIFPQLHNVGALSLNTSNLKTQLKKECADWKIKFCSNLHKLASGQLTGLADYMKKAQNMLGRHIVDIDSLRFVMNILREVRGAAAGRSPSTFRDSLGVAACAASMLPLLPSVAFH